MRKYLFQTATLFISIELIIVLAHSFLEGYGFHPEYSYSRYIGLEFWSSTLFLVSNVFVLLSLSRFFRIFDGLVHLSPLEKFVSIVMACALLGLSIFPVGLFDTTWGEFGIVSILHRTFAAVMFIFTVFLVFLLLLRFHHHRRFFLAAGAFISYGFVFVLSFALNLTWLSTNFLIPESIFLAFFLFLLAFFLPVSEEDSEKSAIIKEKKVEE